MSDKKEGEPTSEEPLFESEVVEIAENKKPDLDQEPFRQLADFLKENPNLNLNFEAVGQFEAQYVVYDWTTYGQIIEKMKAQGWSTPSLEQAILFAKTDKTFSLLICLDEKRNVQIWIDSRGVSNERHKDIIKNYSVSTGQRDGVDLEEDTASDREILFVRNK